MSNDHTRSHRNRSTRNEPPESTEIVPADDDVPAAVVKRGASQMDVALAFKGADLAPIFVTLAEGDLIQGIFVRRGRVRTSDDKPDRVTGVVGEKFIPTLVVRKDDALYEFNQAHEIERALTELTQADSGKVEITILRGPDVRVGTNSVTRYRIATRRIG